MTNRKSPIILALGGGHGQLNTLKRITERGYSLCLADFNPDCPGRMYADRFINASTFDAQGILKGLGGLLPDGIITLGTDQPVYTAALIADKLDLPFYLSPDQARAVTNKRFMKPLFDSSKVPTSPWICLDRNSTAADLRNLVPPLVVKPVDSQGQRGIFFLENRSAYERYRDDSLSFSKDGYLIVEEYYPSVEVTVSGWVHRSQTEILAISDRVTKEFRPHIGLCFAHRFPSTFAAGMIDEIKKQTERVVDGFAIAEGPIYFQFLLGEEGVRVNEVACRVGGAYEEFSLPAVTGVDIIGRLIDCALDCTPDPGRSGQQNHKPTARCFSVPLMFCRPGRVARLGNPEEVLAVPGVLSFRYLVEPGTVIGDLENSVQRAAFLVAAGEDGAEVNRTLKEAFKRIRILDTSGENLIRDTLRYATLGHAPIEDCKF